MALAAAGRFLRPLRRLSPRGRASVPPPFASLAAGSVITLRIDESSASTGRLAGLVEAPRPYGPSLVAEVDGEPRAAVSLAGGPLLSDPFHPSTELGSLLRLRLAQLDAAGSGERPRL
jgi:hypothetical protein